MTKPRVKVNAGESVETAVIRHNDSASAIRTIDSFGNFVARVGRGTGNQNDASRYGFNPYYACVHLELEFMYRRIMDRRQGGRFSRRGYDARRRGYQVFDLVPKDVQTLDQRHGRLKSLGATVRKRRSGRDCMAAHLGI